MRSETIDVEVSADTAEFDAAMQSLSEATEDFGRIFSTTISRSIQSGKGFEDTLRSIGRRFTDLALDSALKPLDSLFENLVGSLATGAVSGFGGTGSFGNPVVPFAKGGVVSSPTAFSFGKKLGVMGEAGPEAILTLGRGPDGRLGVATNSTSGGGVNVTFNVTATDAASFRKSEGQVTAMLARAVSRGQRGL